MAIWSFRWNVDRIDEIRSQETDMYATQAIKERGRVREYLITLV